MKIDYDVAVEMRARGMSYGQIARRFKMTAKAVSQAFKRGYTGPKTKTYIGPLCRRGHDDGGGSERYERGSCVRCTAEARAARAARGGTKRPRIAETYA